MKRVYNPMLFLLSNVPDVEKNLELLMTILQATTDSVRNIKNGIDNFHSTILKMTPSRPGPASSQPSSWVSPTVETPQPEVKPEPSANPNSPDPVIQMPAPENRYFKSP